MKVLVIDPVTATIREEEWDGSLELLYKWIRTDIVTPAPAGRGRTLWVDQEGGMKQGRVPQWFIPDVYPTIIIGPGVLSMGIKPRSDIPSELKGELEALVKWGLLYNPHGPVAGSG